MTVARTFWEKATAAHVFCRQGRIRGERYARHWYDLTAIARSPHFAAVTSDSAVASAVAGHKSCFFVEKDAQGHLTDYASATTGQLNVPPEGEAKALAKDYAAMLGDEVIVRNPLFLRGSAGSLRRSSNRDEQRRTVSCSGLRWM